MRARVRDHLQRLKDRFPELLADCEIVESTTRTTPTGCFVPKEAWSQVLVALNEEMDYDNFKSAVAQHQGVEEIGYERSLHEVWSVMHRLQKRSKR